MKDIYLVWVGFTNLQFIIVLDDYAIEEKTESTHVARNKKSIFKRIKKQLSRMVPRCIKQVNLTFSCYVTLICLFINIVDTSF